MRTCPADGGGGSGRCCDLEHREVTVLGDDDGAHRYAVAFACSYKRRVVGAHHQQVGLPPLVQLGEASVVVVHPLSIECEQRFDDLDRSREPSTARPLCPGW